MPSRSDRLLGSLGVAFYVAHAAYAIGTGKWPLAFWTCHLASLLVGAGFILSSRLVIAIGCLWLAVGTPLWLLDVSEGGTFFPTSVLTHGGGLALALRGACTMGLPRGSWWRAIAAFAVAWIVTRNLTPPYENVNFSHAIWQGWESRFHGSYPAFLAVVVLVNAAYFYALERLIGRLTGR